MGPLSEWLIESREKFTTEGIHSITAGVLPWIKEN